jgi:hypothetical protein
LDFSSLRALSSSQQPLLVSSSPFPPILLHSRSTHGVYERPSSEFSQSTFPSYDPCSRKRFGRDSPSPTSILHTKQQAEQGARVAATERRTWALTNLLRALMRGPSQATEEARIPLYRRLSSWLISLFPSRIMCHTTTVLIMDRGMVIRTGHPRPLYTPNHMFKGIFFCIWQG